MTAPNPYELAARAEKVRKLTRGAEALLAKFGVKDFAAPGLVEIVTGWPAAMWTTISAIAGVSVCAEAPKGERVCSKCIALVLADFRERPAVAAAVDRITSVEA